MKTAECEGVETVGALLADAVPATVESVEPIEGSHNVKAVVDAGRYGQKTVVCGAPNCRAGHRDRLCSAGREDGFRRGERRHAGERRRTRNQSRSCRDYRTAAAARRFRCPDSVIEIDNKSITHRPDLWGHHGMAREVAAITGKKLRDPVWLEHAAGGRRAGEDRDRRPGAVPAIQRAGFRECDGAAVAVVAAIPADGGRFEPDQQHCRSDELHHGGAGAADACVRSGEAAWRHDLGASGARGRANCGVE